MITLHYLCRFVEEQVRGEQKKRDSSRFVYQFADQNPYVGHPNPLKEGQDLFRRGLLSEAVLALEAEVMKNPDNAEGWRLLGITHAENDDDRQVCCHFYSNKFSFWRVCLIFVMEPTSLPLGCLRHVVNLNVFCSCGCSSGLQGP